MPRTTIIVTISISPEIAKQLEELTKKERRTRSELLREALRRYIASESKRDLLFTKISEQQSDTP